MSYPPPYGYPHAYGYPPPGYPPAPYGAPYGAYPPPPMPYGMPPSAPTTVIVEEQRGLFGSHQDVTVVQPGYGPPPPYYGAPTTVIVDEHRGSGMGGALGGAAVGFAAGAVTGLVLDDIFD